MCCFTWKKHSIQIYQLQYYIQIPGVIIENLDSVSLIKKQIKYKNKKHRQQGQEHV